MNKNRKKYAVDIEELKKESAEKLPDGIVQNPTLFAFQFDEDEDPEYFAWKINRHIWEIEGDPKTHFWTF